VFVLHWNQPRACAATVEALRAQSIGVEVTVVDNGSKPEQLAALRMALGETARIIALPANVGWGAAFNGVLKEWIAQPGAYCVLSAHDALAAPDCLERLALALDGDAALGMVCPEYGDGAVLRYSRLRGLHAVSIPAQPAGTVEMMPSPHGTLVMCRSDCLRAAGLFDERFFAYGDEAEIGLRAARHGWASAMIWGARVVNPATSTPSAVVGYLAARNNLLLTRLQSGAGWAWVRLALKVATGVRGQHGTWRQGRIWRARIRGVIDFARGRFGPPPREVL
jgi:N-acetylglucosaminyl-diphospho-decaprenol L-rhamnosyltransferase